MSDTSDKVIRDVGMIQSQFSEGIKEHKIKKMIEKMKSERSTNEEIILKYILRSEPIGKSTKSLQLYTKLHRDTIHSICKDLITKGLVIKSSKNGNYHLTEKAYGYVKIQSHRFKEKIKSNMLNWEIPLDMENAFCTYDEENQRWNIDELSIFRFANRIGAVIVYTMIEALKPDKWIQSINRSQGNKKGTKSSIMNAENKDRLTIQWVRQVIDPITLLWMFAKLPNVKTGEKRYRGRIVEPPPKSFLYPPDYDKRPNKEEIEKAISEDERTWENDYSSNTQWEVDANKYDKLVETFKKLYPSIYEQLEIIRKGMDDEVESLLSYETNKSLTKQT